MFSLYFGLDVFCQFEARVTEFDAVFSVSAYTVRCILYSQQLQYGGGGAVSNSGTPASKRPNTASPNYNDNISLLIWQHLIFDGDILIFMSASICHYFQQAAKLRKYLTHHRSKKEMQTYLLHEYDMVPFLQRSLNDKARTNHFHSILEHAQILWRILLLELHGRRLNWSTCQ
jgi:hypothetical protein